MSQSFEIQGTVHSIGDTTEYGNNGFTKREFVIRLTGENENEAYPNYIALELIKDKCALIDEHGVGDEIQVQFNLSGRLWSAGDRPEKCFTSLQAWRITPVSEQSTAHAAGRQDSVPPPADDDEYNDIPF